MVRLNRRSRVCPAGCSVSFHTIRTDTGWFRWGPAGTECGWVEHKYQFMLNKTAGRPLWGAARLGTLLGPEETPVGVVLGPLPAWIV